MSGNLFLYGNAVLMGKKRIGYLSRDAEDVEKIWYISPRRREKHFFKIWKGWGISVDLMKFLEENGVYGVKLVINNVGTPNVKERKMEIETSSLPMLHLHGHEQKYEPYELQLIMAEKHWLREGQVML